MKIPEKIRIGDTDFEIKVKRLISWNSAIGGQIDYNNRVLRLRKGLRKKELEGTFFHEVAHGILKEMEFNYPFLVKYRGDEKFVQK